MVVLSSLCPSVYHYQIVFSPYFNIEILTLSPYFELNMTFHFLFISIDCTLSETSSILFIFILFIYKIYLNFINLFIYGHRGMVSLQPHGSVSGCDRHIGETTKTSLSLLSSK